MHLPYLKVDFERKLRDWDGFGVNYVEACQTRDYDAYPQEYGGFRCLTETQRREIVELVFGDDGLKPGVAKMFLDCWHQPEPGAGYSFDPNAIDPAAYDHDRTTSHMLQFIEPGAAMTRARGGELPIIITLYGPPAWMTKQKFVRGRDIDPALKTEVAKYMIAWAKYLRDQKGLSVRYISLHNEGEDWPRWDMEGATAGDERHDYNMYWPPEQVVDFLRFMPAMLRAQGMDDVTVAPGECTGWQRFHTWGYAEAIANDDEALNGLGLITSHGFFNGDMRGPWFNDWRSAGIDALREKRPDLHAWVTSTSWSKMDAAFIDEMRHSIYSAKVNAIIPWACIQLQGHWAGGDPNPGTAFRVYDDGRYEVTKGYYFYKQLCRAGQPGMSVSQVQANDRSISLIGFGRNGTQNADNIVVINRGDEPRDLTLHINGSQSTAFDAFVTSSTQDYESIGVHPVTDHALRLTIPAQAVMTLFGQH